MTYRFEHLRSPYVVLALLLNLIDAESCRKLDFTTENSPGSCERQVAPSSGMALVIYNEDNIFPLHKKERKFSYAGNDIVIKQDWSGLGVAAVVWEAAEVLCEFLDINPDIIKGKNVIELGAGTGLVGIVAALLGAKITITDRKEVMSYLEQTVKTNLPEELFEQAAVLPLDWTRDLGKFNGTFDAILGADIVYVEEAFDDLLKVLIQLSDQNTVILLSCKIRYDRDSNFLHRLKEFFQVDKVLHDNSRDIDLYKVVKR